MGPLAKNKYMPYGPTGLMGLLSGELYYNPTKYYLQYNNSQVTYITIPLNTTYNIITLR